MELAAEADEELGFLYPAPLPLLGLGIGLGVGLGFFFLARARTLKPISTSIKLADGAIKGARALRSLHSPSPQTLLLATKVLTKGFKASASLISTTKSHPRNPNPAIRRLRSYVATANLVKYAHYFTLLSGDSRRLGFLLGEYKLSKNLVSVLEGVVGLRPDSAVRQGIDVLGLAAKAAAITREILGWKKRKKNRLGFGGDVCWSSRIRLRSERSYFYANSQGIAVKDFWFGKRRAVVDDARDALERQMSFETNQPLSLRSLLCLLFNFEGDWAPVVVDGWIPCVLGARICCQPTSKKSHELWVFVLEKA